MIRMQLKCMEYTAESGQILIVYVERILRRKRIGSDKQLPKMLTEEDMPKRLVVGKAT